MPHLHVGSNRWLRRHSIRIAAVLTGIGTFFGILAGGGGAVTASEMLESIVVGVLAAVPVLLVEGGVRRLVGVMELASHGGLVEVVAATQAEAPAAAKPAPRPESMSTFRGRTAELATLTALHDRERAYGRTSAAGGAVVLLIHGMPGAGKSVLAQEFALRLARQYPDGQIYANFGTAGGARSPAEILKIFLLALGWSEEDMPAQASERASIFRSMTAGRRILFIFDAARHHDQVRQVLPTDPGCAVVVTSRRDLGPALNAPSLLLDVPGVDEALEILGAVSRVDWTKQAEYATEIVDLCGRLPLAIRSAAERVALDGTDLRHVVDHLRPEGTRLERLERSGHRVRERIASEYRRLVPREQRALCLLTLVRSPTFLPWVLGPLLNVEQAEAENIMASLGTAQLLDNAGHDKATGLARYQFNPLVRLFATAEAARHADRMATARVRLDEAYLEVVSKVLGELPEGLPRQQQTHRWLPPSSRVHARIAELPDHGVRAEYANLIRTVEVADDRREWTMCWRVAARLHGCVPNRAELRDSVFAFGRAIRAAKTDTNPLGEIDVRLAKASFLIAVERYPWAFEVLADADARARDLEVADPREAPYAIGRQAVAHRKLAEAFLQMGAYRDASAPLATAARLAERAGSTDEMRLVRLLQAENHRVLSPEPTYADLVEGQLEDPVYFRAHLGLSEAARRRGDWHSAQEHLMTAWYHSNGDARRMAAVHYRLSRLHIDQWRHGKDDLGVPKDAGVTADDSELPRQAIRRAAEAALAFRCMDNPVGLVRARCQLVRALTIAGHLLEAEQLCHSVERSLVALRIFAGHAWSPLTARFARARGELLLHRRDVPAAWRTLVIAGTLFADNDDWASQAEVWRLLDAAQRVHPYPSGAAHMSVGGVLDTAVMPAPPARLPGGWLEYGATAPVLPRQRGNGEAPDRRRRRLP